MRREIVEIDEKFGKEYAGRYVFQEISWAKRSRIIQKHTKYHPQTGQILSSDFVAIQAETIWASLKEQPPNKPITLEKLLSEGEDGIPVQLGELFSQVVNKLCGLTSEELKNSCGQCGVGNPTQASSNSACVRSSDGHHYNCGDNQLRLWRHS